jgi:hypothetical protein
MDKHSSTSYQNSNRGKKQDLLLPELDVVIKEKDKIIEELRKKIMLAE